MNYFAGNSLTFNTNPSKVSVFFDDLNNLKFIMPEQVENWKSDENNCEFFVKNIGNLGMKKGTFVFPHQFTFISNESSRVNFVLHFHLKHNENVENQGYFEICAEMNPMVEMMAKRPLTNFVNILTINFQRFLTNNK